MQGSPEVEVGEYLAIARIVKPQGRRGEVAAEILTDFPERLAKLRRVFLERAAQAPEPATLENVWPHKGRMVLKFLGVDSIEAANRLRGLHVLVPRAERVPLPAHTYYVWELRDCRVVVERDGAPREVGKVIDVEPTGGAPLLHVMPDGEGRSEILIPLAEEICKRIDTAAKTIVIDPPEDLLELNEQRRLL